MSYTTPPHPFITYLQTLSEDRGALAALRRGLGQPPGAAPDMFPYIIPRLPAYAHPNSWTETAYYLIAALFAYHPDSVDAGNMGDHFARTLDPNPDYNIAIERRFTTLLAAHPDDLHFHLRQAVSYLKSKEIPINWHQLMRDLLRWSDLQRATDVKKRWANSFWRRGRNEDETE